MRISQITSQRPTWGWFTIWSIRWLWVVFRGCAWWQCRVRVHHLEVLFQKRPIGELEVTVSAVGDPRLRLDRLIFLRLVDFVQVNVLVVCIKV